MKKGMNKHGQVWVETVIYTLIALALIGIMLAFAKPKIDAMRDRMLIEQTIDSLNKISEQIYEVQISPQNKRTLSVKITKGRFYVDSVNNQLGWILDSQYKYSEVGQNVKLGKLIVRTDAGNPYKVSVYSNYSTNITLNGLESSYEFESAPAPYTIVIENMGQVPASSGALNIDLKVQG